MKYIEVNSREKSGLKHIIPLDKIVDFSFTEKFTTITLISGKDIKVKESESTIKEMLSYYNANLINEEDIRTFYEGLAEFQAEQESPYYYEGDDELPF